MIDELTLLKFLGKGSYGEVYLTKKEGKSELFATKKMDRKFADQPQVSKYLKNEISILRELKHKNIVKLEDVKVTKNHYYIVMEYCNGGSLSDCLKKYKSIFGQPFTQEIVQYIMRQIINVMKYIHSKGIIHRDLKLDNILVNFNNEYDKNSLNMLNGVVKIIDFGLSTHIGNSNLCYSTVGSPINMDPNILIKMNENKMGINTDKMLGYDQKADIWSLGTLCYEMLIGKSAFNSKTMQELIYKVQNGTYAVPTKLSKEVVSFLNAMLQFNSKKRLSCDELSRHAFLTKNVLEFEPIDLTKVSDKVQRNNLNNYQGYGVGYDGISAYDNTNSNNQGYGYANYPQQYLYSKNDKNKINIESPQSGPLTEKVEDEPSDDNSKPNVPKIGPVIEIPSFGVPSPDDDPNEKGYEFSSGIFVHIDNKDDEKDEKDVDKDCGYSSVYQGYGSSSGL